jgi:alkanesulfonate monooxygenase SsuD/methylene tetrahydromethanopterin reductase-like flavin-dependent oxidoreductase (luciferase family)
MWVLGSGETSARLAAELRAHYAYSLFFGGGLTIGPPLVAQYRAAVRPDPTNGPRTAIALSVVCATTDAGATRIDAELVAQGCHPTNVVGSPETCARAIASFAALFEVDEVFVATFMSDRRARIGMYERLAAAMRLRSTKVRGSSTPRPS